MTMNRPAKDKELIKLHAKRIASALESCDLFIRGEALFEASNFLREKGQNYTANCVLLAAEHYGYKVEKQKP